MEKNLTTGSVIKTVIFFHYRTYYLIFFKHYMAWPTYLP